MESSGPVNRRYDVLEVRELLVRENSVLFEQSIYDLALLWCNR